MTKQNYTKQVEETKMKLEAIFADEEEVKRFLSFEEPEDVQSYLKEKDIEMTVDQIKAMKELFEACAEGKVSMEDMQLLEKGEIPESMLADVNGDNMFFDNDETTDNILTGATGALGGAVTAIATCCMVATDPVGVGVVACLAVGAAGAIATKYVMRGAFALWNKINKW